MRYWEVYLPKVSWWYILATLYNAMKITKERYGRVKDGFMEVMLLPDKAVCTFYWEDL